MDTHAPHDDRHDAHRSTASVAGHPIHPAVVPVPIGLLSGAAMSDVVYLLSGDAFFARASRWLLRGGIVTGVAAASLGAIDFFTIGAARNRTGVAHAGGNALVMGVSVLSLVLRRQAPRTVPLAAAALTAAATMVLGVTGWLGGELTFRHRIGVVPDAER